MIIFLLTNYHHNDVQREEQRLSAYQWKRNGLQQNLQKKIEQAFKEELE